MRDRSYRRWRREIAIAHAFHVRFYDWDWKNDWNTYYFRDKVVGVDKWECQDENRKEVMESAVRVANHLRVCSCYHCKKYGPWGPTLEQKKQQIQMKCDRKDFQETTNGTSLF